MSACNGPDGCTREPHRPTNAPAPPPREWRVSVHEIDYGVRLVDHDEITVRSSGEVVVRPPRPATPLHLQAAPGSLASLARLLVAPEIEAMRPSRLAGEGSQLSLSIDTPARTRSWTFAHDRPAIARRIVTLVGAIRARATARPGTFRVTVAVEEHGAAHVVRGVVIVTSEGRIETHAPGAEGAVAQVAPGELAPLQHLLSEPALASQRTPNTQEPLVHRITLISPSLTRTLALQTREDQTVPEPAGRLILEVERLRALAFNTVLAFTVELSRGAYGAGASRPDTFVVTSAGRLVVRHGDGSPDATVDIAPTELASLQRLLVSREVAELASTPPRGEGERTLLSIRVAGGARTLAFNGPLPAAAAPLVTELERLRRRVS